LSVTLKDTGLEKLLDHVVNEEARLNALRNLRLLDSAPSDSFDRLTRLASQLLAAPVSTISLTDRDRQWFKSKVGVDLIEIPREQAPCAYAIEGRGVFVVPDLKADPRFVGSPLAQAGIRFYAGAPLFTARGTDLAPYALLTTRSATCGTARNKCCLILLAW
jgi:GAF domain-containing protein